MTKLGQKPLRQEKSLLQADWSMARLRPNSVSTGTTDRQFDCTRQSPQPSQTCSLMNDAPAPDRASCRACGGGAFRRRRSGRRSAPRRRGLRAVRAARRRARRGGGSARRAAGRRSRRTSPAAVGDDDDLADAFGRELARDCGTLSDAVDRLAAGHRHGVVVEDLVGDRSPWRRRPRGWPAGRSGNRCRRRD